MNEWCDTLQYETILYCRRSTPSKPAKANEPVKREGPKVRVDFYLCNYIKNVYLISKYIVTSFWT